MTSPAGALAGAYDASVGALRIALMIDSNPLSGQLTWNTGLGAINHLLGPSDQQFRLAPGAGQSIGLVIDDATTNAVVDVLKVYHTTTGTAADGIGTGVVLYAEDASGNIEEAGRIQALFTTAAHATQAGRLDITAMGAAAGTGITVFHTGVVSIGSTTATLGTALQVVGGSIGINATGAHGIYLYRGGTLYSQITTASNHLTVQLQNNASMDIYGGNVGIGNVPTQRLDLAYGHLAFTPVTAPGAATIDSIGAGGLCTDGDHYIKVTFVTATGETELGTASAVATCGGGNNTINLSAIPTGPAGTGTTQRKLYMTKVGSASVYYALATIADNTTTTYAISVADAGLGADSTYRTNRTAGGIYFGNQLAGKLDSIYGNTAWGVSALSSVQVGYYNCGFGVSALEALTSGVANTATGRYCGALLTTGSYNVLYGYACGDNLTTGSGNLLFGTQIDAPSATGSYQLSIGNAIFGTNIDGGGTSISTGNIGLFTNAPAGRLHVYNGLTTPHGVYIEQVGVLAANQHALYIHSNAAQVNGNLLRIVQDNASSSEWVGVIDNDGAGGCLFLRQDGVGAGSFYSFEVYSNAAQVNVELCALVQSNASSTKGCILLWNNGSGDTIYDNTGAKLTNVGVWTDASSKRLKTNFRSIDEAELEAKIVALPVSRYEYIRAPGRDCIGPTAEDLYEALGIGDDKTISAKDLAGVALAMVKKLVRDRDRLEARLSALEEKAA